MMIKHKKTTKTARLASMFSCAAIGCLSLLAFSPITAFAADLPGDIGSNLALGKRYVSSDKNPSGWDDGLTDGIWNSEKDNTYASGRSARFPKTVTIDLEETQRVAFVYVGVPNIGSTKTIEISLSDDGDDFKAVGKHDFQMEVENNHLYEFNPASARYVRLTFLGNHQKTSAATKAYPKEYCFVSEVEVFGPRGSGKTVREQVDPVAEAAKGIARDQAAAITERPPANLGQNLAISKPWVCSDPNPSNWDSGLTDGFWLMRQGHTFATGNAKKFPKTVTIDLKTSAWLTHVYFGVPNFGSTKDVSVSVSYDGEKFTGVGKHTFTLRKAESKVINFNPVLSRYVRLTYEDNYDVKNRFDAAYCFTTEVEVYAQPRK